MGWFSGWFGRFSAYDGANQSRHRENRAGIVTFPNDEDRAVGEYGRELLRLECRDLRRNNPLVAATVGRFSDNVISTGIMPQAKTSDPNWNRKAEAFFHAWAKQCDHIGRMTFWQSQRSIVESLFDSGEIGIIKTKAGKLQFIEAERVRSPSAKESSCIDGIKLNDEGATLGYYVHRRNEGGTFTGADYSFIDAANFIHLYNCDRPDQIRGIPKLAPVINAVRDLDEYIGATLLKAKHEAKNFFTVENEGGSPRIAQEPRRYVNNSEAGATDKPIEKVETGQIVYLRKGEKMNNVANVTPGTNFSPFTERITQYISAAVGFPAELLTLSFGNTSFSGNRTILQQAYRVISIYQNKITTEYCQRVWNWRIGMAINKGDLPPAPVDQDGISEFGHVYWQTPEFLLEDPQTEAQSAMLRITGGAGSVTEWCRKRGRGDASEIFAEKATDIGEAVRMANEVNAKYPGANVTWRDFTSTKMPGQVTSVEARATQQTQQE